MVLLTKTSLQKAKNKNRQASFKMSRVATTHILSIHNACSVRPQCLFRPSTMLVPSAHNACSESLKALFRPSYKEAGFPKILF